MNTSIENLGEIVMRRFLVSVLVVAVLLGFILFAPSLGAAPAAGAVGGDGTSQQVASGENKADAQSQSPAEAAGAQTNRIGLEDLQPGDLLICRQDMFLVIFVFYTHVGIYVGDGLVAEARLEGVKLYPVSDWAYPKETYVRYLRVKTDEAKRRQAAAWARAQTERKPPPIYWPRMTRHANPSKRTWYCSELVWASYYWQGVDFYTRGGYGPSRGMWVSTDRIFHDDDVYEIGSHTEKLPWPGLPLLYPRVIL